LEFEYLGGTIDDAAGEAFDKVASMLGLPYPGGPSIQRAAEGGNARAYPFPRAFLRDDRLDFSFSGLKTAVRYAIEAIKGSGIRGQGSGDRGQGSGVRNQGSEIRIQRNIKSQIQNLKSKPLTPLPSLLVSDLAASFQEAVTDCLVGKAFAALQQTGLRILCVGGGVAANARIRQRLQEEADRQKVDLHIAPLRLCTDNAVMGAIAVERLQAGLIEGLDLDITPGVVRDSARNKSSKR
jgi:N6-L-threonylcarbamoyladenine synthase